MSPETVSWLLALLDTLTLNAGAADFDEAVGHVQRARAELNQVLHETDDPR